jgi:hypothetical protein
MKMITNQPPRIKSFQDNPFEESVIYTYKHFLHKSKDYFQGDLFKSIGREIDLVNNYNDDAINRAYKYYESKLKLKLEIFGKIGATDLYNDFSDEYAKLTPELANINKPKADSSKMVQINKTIRELEKSPDLNMVYFVRDNNSRESWGVFSTYNSKINFYNWAKDHLLAGNKPNCIM